MAEQGGREPAITASTIDWLASHLPSIEPPLRFECIAGGRSNLTFLVTDRTGYAVVLRRPPLGTALPSAHDVGREHRILSALHGGRIPTPRPLAFHDGGGQEAPFYVMEYVPGVVVRDEQAAQQLSPQGRLRASEALVDVLVDLHDVDPAEVGLGELGRRTGYIHRQLRRWKGQWDQGRTRDLDLIDELHDHLQDTVPAEGPARIVHGDYRLDNAILGEDGTVRAVLDWEICTLGDPLADVGLMLVYWSQAGDDPVLADAPTRVPGFFTRQQVIDRYARRSGRDLSMLDFYVAFGYWKLAVVLEGVYARYRAGAYGDDEAFAQYADSAVRLAHAAADVLAESRH